MLLYTIGKYTKAKQRNVRTCSKTDWLRVMGRTTSFDGQTAVEFSEVINS